MAMSEDVDGDTAEQIPILAALGVPDARTAATARMKSRAGIRAEQERLLALFDGCGGFVV